MLSRLATLLLLLQPLPPPALAGAQGALPPARIEVTTPFPVRLGSVGPREVREAVFGLRNLHDRSFRLRVLDLSLGTSLDEAQLAQPLQPGEVRTVRVRVDASGLQGSVKGAVRLGTDDPAQPTYILRYDMVVRPEVSVDAERRSLGEVAPHESPEARFRFVREGGEPLRLALGGTLPGHLDAELVHAGVSADLRVTLRPDRLEPGVTAGLEVLQVASNASAQPLFTLYLDWRLALPVVATPSRLVFADLATTVLTLALGARDGRPFRILGAEIQGQGFELLDRPGAEAVRHQLRIRRAGGGARALLVLDCSNLKVPLKVPLRFLDPNAPPAEERRPAPPPAGEKGLLP